eukprot:4669344-Pyramimonas_sp.AAC.1
MGDILGSVVVVVAASRCRRPRADNSKGVGRSTFGLLRINEELTGSQEEDIVVVVVVIRLLRIPSAPRLSTKVVHPSSYSLFPPLLPPPTLSVPYSRLAPPSLHPQILLYT